MKCLLKEPKETCTEIPEPVKYQPRQFTTTALQQVKVELTWDETDPGRQEFTQKLNSGKLQDIDKNDLQTYLASGSENDSGMILLFYFFMLLYMLNLNLSFLYFRYRRKERHN